MGQGITPSMRAAPPEPLRQISHNADFFLGFSSCLGFVLVFVLLVYAVPKIRKRKTERTYPKLVYSRDRTDRKTA